MGKIKKLDDIIANKIAAGEVIEKLGNVVTMEPEWIWTMPYWRLKDMRLLKFLL